MPKFIWLVIWHQIVGFMRYDAFILVEVTCPLHVQRAVLS
jgi:hypothetical protein